MRVTVATAEREAAGAWVEVGAAYVRAQLAANEGQFDEARAHDREAERLLAEYGFGLFHAAHGLMAGETELAAGSYEGAIAVLRRSRDALLELGDRGFRSTVMALLAQALYETGKPDEAEAAALEAEELSGRTDVINFAMGRGVRACIHADRAELERAEELARSAVTYAFETDFPKMRGDALLALAYVLRAAQRLGEAGEAAKQAIEIYAAKGDRVSAERARAFMAE
jgi:tetratricopeptide (TPR) repeat protein